MKQANGGVHLKGGNYRAFIQAKSKKRMLEILNECISGYTSMNHFNNYWSFMWNDGMKAVGGDEEGLWIAPETGFCSDYKDFKKIF